MHYHYIDYRLQHFFQYYFPCSCIKLGKIIDEKIFKKKRLLILQANINHEGGKPTCNNPESTQIEKILRSKVKLLLIKPLKMSIGFYFSITINEDSNIYILPLES